MNKNLKKKYKKSSLEESAKEYLKEYDSKKSIEQVFSEFEDILKYHDDFEIYLKERKLNEYLEKMQRNKRLLAKRKLFIEWYFNKSKSEVGNTKKVYVDLSELTFTTKRTVQKALSGEATAHEARK